MPYAALQQNTLLAKCAVLDLWLPSTASGLKWLQIGDGKYVISTVANILENIQLV
jgi:hypothetical protein